MKLLNSLKKVETLKMPSHKSEMALSFSHPIGRTKDGKKVQF